MKAIGIDLGTTNSVAAFYEVGQQNPRILSTGAGENLTPSIVCFRLPRRDTQQGEILVGRAALNYAPSAPENTIFSVKRLMGRDYNDPAVATVLDRFNYEVVRGPNEDPRVYVRLGGQDYTPSQISEMILRKIKEDASRALGEEVTHAVITVPAYFNEGQRAATREAGEEAGLVVKKIIDEPTAAAVAFGVQVLPGERHRILVFDLGGGTFDISILQMVKDQEGRGQWQVLQIEGNNWLGGDDFDGQIVEKVTAWVKNEYGEDPSRDKRFLLLAKKHAEEAKRALGNATEADIVIPAGYRTVQGTTVDVEVSLTREEFETMIRGYVDACMSLVYKALSEQDLPTDDITDVLLVGGSTLTPLVYRTVENYFGVGKIRRSVNPMECVALGASVLAATLRGVECPKCKEENDETATQCKNEKCKHNLASARSIGDNIIIEPTAMSLGIAAVKGNQRDVFVPIIPKGTLYPLREPMKQRFQATSGRHIVVPVYEGDESVASRNAEQGVIEYELPEEIDINTPVEVSFNYDRNRELTVTISVPGTRLFKTEPLRRNMPRTVPPRSMIEEEIDDQWQEELEHAVDFSSGFLEQYKSYMEPNQAMKLQRDIERAQQSLIDEMEGRRMIRILQTDVFNCGLATQLFLADRATNGAAPEVAQQINEAAKKVRQAHDSGDRERGAEQARVLKVLVARAVERRTGVKEVADQEDYGGLLRLLGE